MRLLLGYTNNIVWTHAVYTMRGWIVFSETTPFLDIRGAAQSIVRLLLLSLNVTNVLSCWDWIENLLGYQLLPISVKNIYCRYYSVKGWVNVEYPVNSGVNDGSQGTTSAEKVVGKRIIYVSNLEWPKYV